jgi:flagellar hook-basal body complex protein FliE
MATNITNAINAYSNAASRPVTQGLAARDSDVSFGDVLEKSAREAIDTMRKGETTSAAAVVGKADLTDVVQAVNNAETTLQTVTALRDKVVSAYQEILKMSM